eukprot:6156093-Amphidinium_carterae.1
MSSAKRSSCNDPVDTLHRTKSIKPSLKKWEYITTSRQNCPARAGTPCVLAARQGAALMLAHPSEACCSLHAAAPLEPF